MQVVKDRKKLGEITQDKGEVPFFLPAEIYIYIDVMTFQPSMSEHWKSDLDVEKLNKILLR